MTTMRGSESPVSIKATSCTTGGKATAKKNESWDHIQDLGQRKKVQNRIAQRSYRKHTFLLIVRWQPTRPEFAKSSVGERIKRRLEALEQFRDASTAGLPPTALSDAHLLDSSTSSDSQRRTSESMVSSPVKMPTTRHSYSPQDQSISIVHATSTSPSEDEINSDLCYTLPEQSSGVLTPSRDGAPYFEACHDQSQSSIWQLGEAIDIRDDVSDISKRPDTENQSLSDQPRDPFSEFMFSLSEEKLTPLPSLANGCQKSKTALQVAAENGKLSLVQLLLSLKSDILARDQMGRTALHLAVYNKHEGVIQELLRNQSNLEVQDSDGQTALHAAVVSDQERVVAHLLSVGADPEIKDSSGRTALHLAALTGCNKILRLLVEKGADIDAKIG